MKNITGVFEHCYLPQKALVLYGHTANTDEVYIEAFDIDDNGSPVNAHPLSSNEMSELAARLNASAELRHSFLTSKGLLPAHVLYISEQGRGYAIWHTPQQQVQLYFKEELAIPSGKAHIPALIWKATRDTLEVYALKTGRKPDIKTKLYHAPFFNIYENGTVCMGTVDVAIDHRCCLEAFMKQWEQYFFNSYFSHLIHGYSPVSGNIVQLWQQQVHSDKPFPVEVLAESGKTLKNLIV